MDEYPVGSIHLRWKVALGYNSSHRYLSSHDKQTRAREELSLCRESFMRPLHRSRLALFSRRGLNKMLTCAIGMVRVRYQSSSDDRIRTLNVLECFPIRSAVLLIFQVSQISRASRTDEVRFVCNGSERSDQRMTNCHSSYLKSNLSSPRGDPRRQ